MSEEQNEKGGFFSNLKNQIITGAGVILTTLGTVFIDEIKSIVGIGGEDEGGAKTEMVQQQQQNNQQNQSVIINIPEQKPAETKTIIKEVPAKGTQPAPAPVKKKEKEQEIDW